MVSAEEQAALAAYAAKHGRFWKSRLNWSWMGEWPHDHNAVLHALRNRLGPRWLANYRLPKESRVLPAKSDTSMEGVPA